MACHDARYSLAVRSGDLGHLGLSIQKPSQCDDQKPSCNSSANPVDALCIHTACTLQEASTVMTPDVAAEAIDAVTLFDIWGQNFTETGPRLLSKGAGITQGDLDLLESRGVVPGTQKTQFAITRTILGHVGTIYKLLYGACETHVRQEAP